MQSNDQPYLVLKGRVFRLNQKQMKAMKAKKVHIEYSVPNYLDKRTDQTRVHGQTFNNEKEYNEYKKILKRMGGIGYGSKIYHSVRVSKPLVERDMDRSRDSRIMRFHS